MRNVCLAVLVAAPAAAQPRLEWGGEAAAGLRLLWEEQSTADGFEARSAPAITGQVGALRWGSIGAALGVDWTTFRSDGGEGTVAVSSRRHWFGVGPHVAWMAPEWRAGILVEALLDHFSTRIELDGAESERASGVYGGVRYGVEARMRLGRAPVTFGVHGGGQRSNARDDYFFGFSFGWIWGAMAPRHPSDRADDQAL